MRKMLVSDYDGTFFRSDKEAKKNIKKINKFINKGNIFVIATGRSYSQIKREIDRLKIRYSYLICNDGAFIYNHIDDPLYRKDINKEAVKKMIEIVEKNKKEIKRWFVDTGSLRTKDITEIANGFIIEANNIEKSEYILKEILENVSGVNGYISRRHINITDIKVSKANGIKELNKILKINEKDIYVIGDEINDVSMLEEFNSYVMETASDYILSLGKPTIKYVGELVDILKNKK